VDNNGGQYERLRKSPEEIKGIKHRDVRGFYERQNMLLHTFMTVDTLLDSVPRRAPETNGETTSLLPQYHPTENTRDAKDARFVRWTIHVNLIINIILFLGKLSVVLISSSISLLASATDSGMDLLSTLILFWASWTISSNDWRRKWMFPVGLRRAEPMGVVVFSVFMISSFVQVSIESCKRLLSNDAEVVALPLEGVIIMVITIVVKFGVWQSSQGSKSSTIRALSQDAENDVFFNTVSLLFPFIGHKLGIWWLDPLGGVALSLYIIVEWIETLRSNIRNLMGVKASADEYQRVAYLIMRFSPCIDAVQHLDVYSSGDQFMVEADLVLPADTTFPMAHYIGESVQYAIESLSGIERAYCHIDYNSNNPSGHLVR
ncbi:uncharacterized protein EI90DRAFT_2941043, partial [Cantharellus anzutake]|uniref:uncharacterized protein n=1 Tax=Cantharellus anzutake TaxID=1750568 RepID=UPI00190498EC